jgi:hypothetical protein
VGEAVLAASIESYARAGSTRFIATRLLATGLIRYLARGRRAVT